MTLASFREGLIVPESRRTRLRLSMSEVMSLPCAGGDVDVSVGTPKNRNGAVATCLIACIKWHPWEGCRQYAVFSRPTKHNEAKHVATFATVPLNSVP